MTKKKVIVCSVILGVILIGLLACEVMYPDRRAGNDQKSDGLR